MNNPFVKWQYVLPGISALAMVGLLAAFLDRKGNLTAFENNLRAFLLTIQYSEGTYGPNAYRTLYGGETFDGYAQHPHIAVTRWGLTSTAAGAYQILFGTWDFIRQILKLPDFSPASQDRAAIELIRRRDALADVLAGRLSAALAKCNKEWASLPGAGYGQHEQQYNKLSAFYRSVGGQIAG